MAMPIDGATASAATQQLQGAAAWQQRRQGFEALGSALKSGDLDAAKKAYTSLSSSFPSGAVSDPSSAMGKLNAALQSGDMQAAQQAFAGMHGHHHHHHQDGDGTTAAPTAASTSSGSTTGGTINVSA